MLSFSGWLREFVSWLRDSFGVVGEPHPHAVEHHERGDNSLWLLYDYPMSGEDHAIPGLAQLWYCRNAVAESDLIICLINTAQARVGGSGHSHPNREEWHRQFEIKVKSEIRKQANVAATHLFLVGWISKKPTAQRIVNGQTRRFRHIDCTSAYAVDLQGYTFAWGVGVNEPAKKIVRAVALRCLGMTASELNTWEALLRSLDNHTNRTTWLTWLEFYASKFPTTRISEKHVLQPPKTKRLQTPEDEQP